AALALRHSQPLRRILLRDLRRPILRTQTGVGARLLHPARDRGTNVQLGALGFFLVAGSRPRSGRGSTPAAAPRRPAGRRRRGTAPRGLGRLFTSSGSGLLRGGHLEPDPIAGLRTYLRSSGAVNEKTSRDGFFARPPRGAALLITSLPGQASGQRLNSLRCNPVTLPRAPRFVRDGHFDQPCAERWH